LHQYNPSKRRIVLMLKKLVLSASFVMLGAGAAWAAGAHEGLQCTGCHNIHYAKGPIIFDVAPNTKAMPQGASMQTKSIAALCLGCHADADKGGAGILPISAHTTHPFGSRVNAKVANVPGGLLRDGIMDCVSCHDPHPSNTNYKYLRVDTKAGKNMQEFCDVCHPAKVDKVNRDAIKIFNSMDEVAGARSVPVSELGGMKAEKAPEKK
jgi:predicted CXXCH cytochrome family protein